MTQRDSRLSPRPRFPSQLAQHFCYVRWHWVPFAGKELPNLVVSSMGPLAREFGFIVFVWAMSGAVGYIRFAAVHGLGAHATVFAAIPSGSNLLKSRTGGVKLALDLRLMVVIPSRLRFFVLGVSFR